MANSSKKQSTRQLSRMALANLSSLKESAIKLENYQYLKECPDFRFSVSHTKDAAIAISGPQESFLSLGVDLEKSTREISLKSEKYFINKDDHFKTDHLLERWCIKEACFKSLSNANEEIHLLKDVQIKSPHFYNKNKGSSVSGQYQIMYHQGYIIAIAYCSLKKISIKLKNHHS